MDAQLSAHASKRVSNRSPAEMVARLADRPAGPLRVEQVDSSLTNTTYRLVFDEETWMLRLAAEAEPRVGIDHRREVEVLRRAAAAGIAPRLIHADPPAGILITARVSGKTWTKEMLTEPKRQEQLVRVLRGVHKLPMTGSVFEPRRLAESYLALLSAELPLYAECVRAAQQLERLSPAAELRCCHNDLVAANVVGDEAPTLIDWEYACDNDPAFDLASLIEFHDLDERAASRLLDAYAPKDRSEWHERLEVQRRAYVRLTLLWCAAYGDSLTESIAGLTRRMLRRTSG